MTKLLVIYFIRLDTSSVFVSESRAEIYLIHILGGHLGRHLGKYATVVIEL